jgi:hypothetical protein
VACKPLDPTGRIEKGPRMEKRPSRDFYDELYASWMSNYKSHEYTFGGPTGTRWMEKELSRDFMMNCQRHG